MTSHHKPTLFCFRLTSGARARGQGSYHSNGLVSRCSRDHIRDSREQCMIRADAYQPAIGYFTRRAPIFPGSRYTLVIRQERRIFKPYIYIIAVALLSYSFCGCTFKRTYRFFFPSVNCHVKF